MARDEQERIRQGQQKDPNRDWAKDYAESDLKHVIQASDARSWNDVIGYLDRKGMDDNELTPGEVIHMKDDISRLASSGGSFTSDVHKAYQMAHRAR